MKKGQIDRVPPHNLEAEQAVLGALFIDEKAIIKISEILVPGRGHWWNHIYS